MTREEFIESLAALFEAFAVDTDAEWLVGRDGQCSGPNLMVQRDWRVGQ
jgi:hypothetical protein